MPWCATPGQPEGLSDSMTAPWRVVRVSQSLHGLNTVRPSDPLIPLDDFHYRNHREGEKAISLPVGGCVTGDGLVDAFAYF